MSKAVSPRDREVSGRPSLKSSKKNKTVASWTTDRELKIVKVRRNPGSPLRLLPRPGHVVEGKAGRVGVLLSGPHVLALRGFPSSYRLTFSNRRYRVEVVPRRGRNGTITGVQGKLITANRPFKLDSGEAQALEKIISHRQRNSLKSALRSLELAKVVADTARLNAETRNKQAATQQLKAEEAQLRAEEEERRSRILADASALLDASFEFKESLQQVTQLLIHRLADWCVVQVIEEGELRRLAVRHRDAESVELLALAFPDAAAEEEKWYSTPLRLIHPQVYSFLTAVDRSRIAPTRSRLSALKKLHVQSLIQTPIRAHGRSIGVLTIGSGDPGRQYDIHDLQMAQGLAYRIGLAHESSVLYADAQREISMRKQAEERMKAFNADLERRVRERTSLLEEATREANSFAYTVAHDLRAPLRAITGFCQALKEDYSGGLDEIAKDYLDRIVAGSRRMDDLIRDLLDYARVNRAEINRSLVDLDEVFDSVMEAMAVEVRERKAVVRRAGPLGRVMAHEPMLHQVITNLLSNGAKFVPRGATPQIDVWSEARDGRVRLCVKDNGIGIAPEHQDRIFGIFERLNRSEDYPGTGIGLAIVRRAVERLGGTVGLESKPSQGSTFWIELPTT